MIFRSALDAEMKDATRAGITLQNKKAEKLPVTQEENKFWEMGLLGCLLVLIKLVYSLRCLCHQYLN